MSTPYHPPGLLKPEVRSMNTATIVYLQEDGSGIIRIVRMPENHLTYSSSAD